MKDFSFPDFISKENQFHFLKAEIIFKMRTHLYRVEDKNKLIKFNNFLARMSDKEFLEFIERKL